MLTAEQVARRVARDLAAGARLHTRDSVPFGLRTILETQLGSGAQVISLGLSAELRAICALGVFDITHNVWTLREVPPGISAAEIQSKLGFALLCGPDLIDVPVEP